MIWELIVDMFGKNFQNVYTSSTGVIANLNFNEYAAISSESVRCHGEWISSQGHTSQDIAVSSGVPQGHLVI